MCNQHLEGLIAKKVDSPYIGARSDSWLKIKCHREQEFVVGGAAFLPGRGTGTFSSLLVGVKSGKGLRYAGRVGGGFSANERAEWHARVQKLEQKDSPFDRHPDKRSGEIWHWMKPKLVIQVAFQDWTQDGILRQPRYLGLRAGPRSQDRGARRAGAYRRGGQAAVPRAKKPRAAANRGARRRKDAPARRPCGSRIPSACCFRTTASPSCNSPNSSRPWVKSRMPHYQDRPLSILRNTHGSQPFFQKHFLEQSGAGLRVVKIPNADKDPDFVVCDSPEGLLHLAQVGAVELHSWGAVMPKPTQADRLTFDLDPGAELDYPPLRDAALAIRKLMQDLGLESWVKTTGGKGLHVVVPLSAPRPDWDTAKDFARSVTLFMERLAPTMFTSKTGEQNRKNKIFVDYLRNGFGATAVAAFSPRWRPGRGRVDAGGLGRDRRRHPRHALQPAQRAGPHCEATQGSVEGLLGRQTSPDQGHDQGHGFEVACVITYTSRRVGHSCRGPIHAQAGEDSGVDLRVARGGHRRLRGARQLPHRPRRGAGHRCPGAGAIRDRARASPACADTG